MTIAYWDRKKYEARVKKLFEDNDATAQMERVFGARKNDPVFNLAARMVRGHSVKYTQFKQLLSTSMHDSKHRMDLDIVLKGMPLMIPGKDPGTIRVYTNLPIDNTNDEAVKLTSWVLYYDVLDTFWKEYQEALKGAGAQAWATFTRAWRKIKRYEEMPTARALTRYTNLHKSGVPDNAIRDIATGIDEQRKPIEIIFADKPEDFLPMYGTGPHSCMTTDNADARGWKEMLKHKHHPTSFFAYHPYVRGAYATYKGSVCTRTFLYQQANGRWQYGRVYHSNDKFRQKFINTLHEMGYTDMGEHTRNKFRREAEFEVPGIPTGTHYVMPMPYCDNLDGHVYAEFNKETKTFKVRCGFPDRINIQHQSQVGFVRDVDLTVRHCSHCGTKHGANANILESNDGKFFCNTNCMRSGGYCRAYRGDGQRLIVLRENAYYDKHSDSWYTNLDAAIKCGALLVINSLEEAPEGEDYTTYGNVIRKNGQLYRYTRAFSDSMAKNLKLTDKEHFGMYIYDVIEKDTSSLRIKLKRQKVVELDDNEPLFVAA